MSQVGAESDWAFPDDTTSRPAAEIAKIRERLESILASTSDFQEWNEMIVEESGASPVLYKRTHMGDLVIDISATQTGPITTANFDPDRDVSPTVTIADVLEVIKGIEGPAVTTEEVADQLDETVPVVQERLAELEERDKIRSRQSGDTMMWWMAEDDQDLLAGFGAFEDSDVPELMKEERRKAREEWDRDSTLSG